MQNQLTYLYSQKTNLQKKMISKNLNHVSFYQRYGKSISNYHLNNDYDLTLNTLQKSHLGQVLISNTYVKGYLIERRSRTYFYDFGIHDGLKMTKNDISPRENMFSSYSSSTLDFNKFNGREAVFKIKILKPGFLDATDYYGDPLFRMKITNLTNISELYYNSKLILGKIVGKNPNGRLVILAGGVVGLLPSKKRNKYSSSKYLSNLKNKNHISEISEKDSGIEDSEKNKHFRKFSRNELNYFHIEYYDYTLNKFILSPVKEREENTYSLKKIEKKVYQERKFKKNYLKYLRQFKNYYLS